MTPAISGTPGTNNVGDGISPKSSAQLPELETVHQQLEETRSTKRNLSHLGKWLLGTLGTITVVESIACIVIVALAGAAAAGAFAVAWPVMLGVAIGLFVVSLLMQTQHRLRMLSSTGNTPASILLCNRSVDLCNTPMLTIENLQKNIQGLKNKSTRQSSPSVTQPPTYDDVVSSTQHNEYNIACGQLLTLYKSEQDLAKKQQYACEITGLILAAKEGDQKQKTYYADNRAMIAETLLLSAFSDEKIKNANPLILLSAYAVRFAEPALNNLRSSPELDNTLRSALHQKISAIESKEAAIRTNDEKLFLSIIKDWSAHKS